MTINTGLEGVVVAETQLSMVDGSQGRLLIAGAEVADLSGTVGFDEVFARLQRAAGQVPNRLGPARARAFGVLPRCTEAFAGSDGMDALRAALALCDQQDPAFIVAAAGVFTAAWWRGRQQLPALAPDPDASHAADLHRMLTGITDPAGAEALDAYLAAVVDHGMNASTFTARVVASTGADLTSAVVAALGALKGPLHGGAPGPVLDMLDSVGSEANATAWVRAELAAGRRIMGMGHRVYRVRDPRAAALENAVERLAERRGHTVGRGELAHAVEQAARDVLAERYPDRPIRANVEFFTAVLLDSIGIDRELFSPLFACSRAAGWCAHIAEQRATGRLIRPRARYVGEGSAIVTG